MKVCDNALGEMLTLLIENYEERFHPLPEVPAHESLKALMQDRGLAHKDVWPVLGNKGAATEILAGCVLSAKRRPKGSPRSSASLSICSSEPTT